MIMDFLIFVALCAIVGVLTRICQTLIALNKTMASFSSGSADVEQNDTSGKDL